METEQQQPDRLQHRKPVLVQNWIADTVAGILNEGQDWYLKVEEHTEIPATDFTILIPQSEIGKVLGKQGRTMRAMRSFLCIFGHNHGIAYRLQIRACEIENMPFKQ